MTPPPSNDPWLAGQPYERYMGRWSRLVAARFVDWLALPPGLDWLDIGCGTGALSDAILAQAEPARVQAVDASAPFIAHLQNRARDARLSFAVGDARRLPVDAASVDVAVSGLMLNFIPDPVDALREAARVTRPGGTLGCYVWDYAGRMDLLRMFWDSAIALDPAASALDEGIRFPLCTPDALVAVFTRAGLVAPKIEGIEVTLRFDHFDDLWAPFLGGQGPAPKYVADLDPERRVALRDRFRSRLPVLADDTIELVARAWAAQGHRR